MGTLLEGHIDSNTCTVVYVLMECFSFFLSFFLSVEIIMLCFFFLYSSMKKLVMLDLLEGACWMLKNRPR